MHDHHSHRHDDRLESRPGPGRRLRLGPPWARDFGMGPGPRRGRRSRRGDVRAAILLLLEEAPHNGYQLIQELSERSHGAWRPSPGSVYPVLAQLEDEGLIEPTRDGEGRGYTLTERGRTEVADRRESMGRPWEAAATAMSTPRLALLATGRQLAGAVRQVFDAASDEQVTQATAVLADARRALYRLLAEADPVTPADR